MTGMKGNSVTMMTGKTLGNCLTKGGEETHEKRRSSVRVGKKRTDRVSGDEGEKNDDNTHRGHTNFRCTIFGGGINL